jgi:putative aminopeptidase FrvX
LRLGGYIQNWSKAVDIDISTHPILSLFIDLLAAPAPSGHETLLAQVVRDKLDLLGYVHRTDGAGNLLVQLPGQETGAPLVCIAAHMDEIGMVVTKIEPDGALLVDRSGGLYPWKLGEGPLEILGDYDRIVGILSMGSTHAPGVADQPITWDRVRILTGLAPEQLKAIGIRPGSPAVPVRQVRGPVLFGDPADPLVGAWTFDDRMGVVILLKLLERLQQDGLHARHPTLIAFTVHEEGGAHGAKALAQRERPEIFISIDGCPIPPGAPLKLDDRPGIWSKDSGTFYDPRLVRALCQAAVTAGTELQPVVYNRTFSDASLVYSVGGAQRVACFGHVRENSHGYEVARLSVFDNVIRTLTGFVTTWQETGT